MVRLFGRDRDAHEVRDILHRARVAAARVEKFAVGRHVPSRRMEQLESRQRRRVPNVPSELVIQAGAVEAPERFERLARFLCASDSHYLLGETTISTRRLLARPSAVPLSATGRDEPRPCEVILSLGMPRD